MDDFGIDLEEVYQVIDSAEVLIVRFALIDKRLLMDAREEEGSAPILKVVPKAGSVEERFRSIKELRPALPLPERVVSFQWPRQIQTLESSGVWRRFAERCGDTAAESAWRELVSAEKNLVSAAIRGEESFQTLWQRT
jgi:hypothetical protein